MLWLKSCGFHCVLGKNENTCVTRLTENRNFVSVHVLSHFDDILLLNLKFLEEQKLESRRWAFPITFALNYMQWKVYCCGTNIYISEILATAFPFLLIPNYSFKEGKKWESLLHGKVIFPISQQIVVRVI